MVSALSVFKELRRTRGRALHISEALVEFVKDAVGLLLLVALQHSLEAGAS